jgi:hypothetical protein
MDNPYRFVKGGDPEELWLYLFGSENSGKYVAIVSSSDEGGFSILFTNRNNESNTKVVDIKSLQEMFKYMKEISKFLQERNGNEHP